MKFLKPALRTIAFAAFLGIALATGCIDSLMFHPEMCRNGYDEATSGYVDIGTNGVRIAAIVLGPERGKKALARCHGNAEDAAGTLWALRRLSDYGYTVASVDYPGYGLSDGKPDEEGCYRNVRRLYDWLVEERGFKPEDVFVDGFSIGTGPATELARSRRVGGLVLEAPFLSAPRAVTRARILPVDPFPNIEKIGGVECPVLVMHAEDDETIPFSQGRAVFEAARGPKKFVASPSGGHNDLPLGIGLERYLALISDFMDGEFSKK